MADRPYGPAVPFGQPHSIGLLYPTVASGCVFNYVGGNQQNNQHLHFYYGAIPEPAIRNLPPLGNALLYRNRDPMFAYSPYRWHDLFCDIPVSIELIGMTRIALQDFSELSDLDNDLKSLHEALQSIGGAVARYKDTPLRQNLIDIIAPTVRECHFQLFELFYQMDQYRQFLNLTTIRWFWRRVFSLGWEAECLMFWRNSLLTCRRMFEILSQAFKSINWMSLGNSMRVGPVPFKQFVDSLRRNPPSLEHIREHMVIVVDHLGVRIPIPFLFCSTWEGFDYVLKGYCKDRVGDHYVEQGAYGVLRSQDTQIIHPVEFSRKIGPGIELEMSIMLRQRNNFRDVQKECPRCHFINTGVTDLNGWIKCCKCLGLFFIAEDKADEKINENQAQAYQTLCDREDSDRDDSGRGDIDPKNGNTEADYGRKDEIPEAIVSPASQARKKDQETYRETSQQESCLIFRRIHVFCTPASPASTKFQRTRNLLPRPLSITNSMSQCRIVDQTIASNNSVINVIVFGESGAGKSSTVNMLAGANVAATSPNTWGGTFRSTPYDVTISNSKYRLYDTAGLDEITIVSPKDALMNLYELVLSLREGVSLLVYVIRGSRVKESTLKNYELFHDIICHKKVPVLLVVTGLENEHSMDGWWDRNNHVFAKHNMCFVDQACITATKGKEQCDGRFAYQREYEESKKKIQSRLHRSVLSVPWRMGTKLWFLGIAKTGWNFLTSVFDWPVSVYSQSLHEALIQVGGYSEKYANNLIAGLGYDRISPVIVFGESGAGKSSVVNMLAGKIVTASSSDNKSRIFRNTVNSINIMGNDFLFYDTTGLDDIATDHAKDAFANLYRLILSLQHGVSLLVFVVHASRVNDSVSKNYKLFYDILCQKHVPIVLVVTGLELEDSMDDWWVRNRAVFDQHNIIFDGQVCITATIGHRKGGFLFESWYQESAEKVQLLILSTFLLKPWRMEPTQWISRVTKKKPFRRTFRFAPRGSSKLLFNALVQICGNSEKEAKALVHEVVMEVERDDTI